MSCVAGEDVFTMDSGWWWIGLLMATACLLYILIDYIAGCQPASRRSPSILMMSRSIFDYVVVFLVFVGIRSDDVTCQTSLDSPNNRQCKFWGGNEYGITNEQIVVTIVANVGNDGLGQMEYRNELQICFMRERDDINIWNVAVIYIPLAIIVFGGIISNIWTMRQFRGRLNDETYKLRWMVIMTQMSIFSIYTVNYAMQGVFWTVIMNDGEQIPDHDPYYLSAFCVVAIVCDAIAWLSRNLIQRIWSHRDYLFSKQSHKPPQKMKELPSAPKKQVELSDALRKEVITFITAGIHQHAIRNSACNLNRPRKRSVNPDHSMSLHSNNGYGTKLHGSKRSLLLPPDHHQGVKVCTFSKIWNPIEDYFDSIQPSNANGNGNKNENDNGDEVENETGDQGMESPVAELTRLQQANGSCDLLSDRFYPSKIDGEREDHVIEEWSLGEVGADGTNVVFTDYAPVVFGYLRRNVYALPDDDYKHSIFSDQDYAKATVAKFSEGRSGAFFFYTKDMKYLVKTLTKSEAQLLLTTLKSYTRFMAENRDSYLSRYLGLHAIKMYAHTIYVVVNKNVFPPNYKSPDETYDIKGSWIDRHTNRHVSEKKLMKDGDLHRKLILDGMVSEQMYTQLEADSRWLSEQCIMDYSLLLGVYYTKIYREPDRKRFQSVIRVSDKCLELDAVRESTEMKQEVDSPSPASSQSVEVVDGYPVHDSVYVEGPGRYVCGVIDMLQEWDLNKKAERLVKGLRGKDRNGVSCVPPKQYQKRFLRKMREIGIGEEAEFEYENSSTVEQYKV